MIWLPYWRQAVLAIKMYVVAIPCLVSYFLFKTKFGNIAAEVNQVTGEMVFTLVRAARGGFDAEGDVDESYLNHMHATRNDDAKQNKNPSAENKKESVIGIHNNSVSWFW